MNHGIAYPPAVFLAIEACITQELRAFSKFGVDVVVMRISACEFLLCSIAKLPAKNFASSTKEVVANITSLYNDQLLTSWE